MKLHPALLHILCSSTWRLATIEGSFDPLVPSRQSAWDFSICRGLNILWPCDLVDSKSVFQLPWHFFYVSSIFSRFSHREIHGRAATFGKNLPDTSATRSFAMMDLGALVLSNQRWDQDCAEQPAAEWVGYKTNTKVTSNTVAWTV